MNKPTDPVLNLLKLLDRPIAFHRVLAEVAGSALGGLMLSQAIYWQGRASKEGCGWWYKTREEWYAETMMNRTEQEAVRRKLKSIGLMDEERRGLPARLYYRINLDALAERLSSIPPPPDLTPQGDNSGPEKPAGQNQKRKSKKPPLPDDPIERTLAIYKPKLKELSRTGYLRAQKAGAVAEYVDYAEVFRQDKGICHICEQLITEGVGQREQHLTFDHVISLAEGGQHTAENIKPAHARCNILKRRTAANKLAEDGPTVKQKPDQQLGPSPANIHTETTAETTSETTTTPDPLQNEPSPAEDPPTPEPASPGSSRRNDEKEGDEEPTPEAAGDHCPLLYFPRAMPREERPRAYEMVAPHNGLAQALLDELAGVMDKGKVQTSRLSILYGMAKNAAAGKFSPALGLPIARRRQDWIDSRRSAAKPPPPASPPPQSPDPPANPRDRPEGLRQLKGVLNKRTLQNHHHQER